MFDWRVWRYRPHQKIRDVRSSKQKILPQICVSEEKLISIKNIFQYCKI